MDVSVNMMMSSASSLVTSMNDDNQAAEDLTQRSSSVMKVDDAEEQTGGGGCSRNGDETADERENRKASITSSVDSTAHEIAKMLIEDGEYDDDLSTTFTDTSINLPVREEAVARGSVLTEQATLLSPAESSHQEPSRSFSNRFSSHQSPFVKNLPICDRDDEIVAIQGIYERVVRMSGSSEVILVNGEAGVGKSYLVETALRNVVCGISSQHHHSSGSPPGTGSSTKRNKGVYVSAKYNQVTVLANEPCSAVYDCLTDLIDLLVQHSDVTAIREAIERAFSFEELGLMASFISNLGHLTKKQYFPSMGEGETLESVNANSVTATRLRILCRSFLKEVAHLVPIVMVVEDIHWADEESILLLKSFLMDTTSCSVLYVMTYRDREMEQNGVFIGEFIRFVCSELSSEQGPEDSTSLSAKGSYLKSTKIDLQNLSVNSIKSIVSYLTRVTDDTRTLPLSEVILNKTLGNPFFVLQFLDSLRRDGFIMEASSAVTSSRTVAANKEGESSTAIFDWDLSRILAETSMSANVLELLEEKVATLDSSSQLILKLASFMGRFFDLSLLCTVYYVAVRGGGDPASSVSSLDSSSYKSQVDRTLLEATEMGLLQLDSQNTSDGARIGFAHDQIQHMFYCMVPVNERSILHFRLGSILKNVAGASVFAVADQLNRGSEHVVSDEDRLELANINCRAGYGARKRNALSAAADYLSTSFDLVIDRSGLWSTLHAATLDLCSCAVEFQCMAGNLLRCQYMYQRVVANSSTFMGTLRVRKATMEALIHAGMSSESIELGLDTLKNLGVHLHRFNRVPVVEAAIAMYAMRSKSDEDVLNMPPATDPKAIAIMTFLQTTYRAAYWSGQSNLVGVLHFRDLRCSLKHGSTPRTSLTLVTLSVTLCRMKRYDDGYRFGQLAMKLAERQNCADVLSWCIIGVFCFTRHWKEPLTGHVEYFGRAHDIFLAAGEANGSLIAGANHVLVALIIGTPLRLVDELVKYLASQAHLYNQTVMGLIFRSLLDEINKLMNVTRSVHPDGQSSTSQGGDYPSQIPATDLVKIQTVKLKVACFLQQWTQAEKLLADLVEMIRSHQIIRCHFVNLEIVFCSGITHFALAKLKNSSIHKVEAQRALQTMKGLVQIGSPDAVALLRFLEAEEVAWMAASAQGTNQKPVQPKQPRDEVACVVAAYERTVQACQQQGYLHYEAFAWERAGTFHEHVRGEFKTAIDCYDRATEKWSVWNAMQKVEQLSGWKMDLQRSVGDVHGTIVGSH